MDISGQKQLKRPWLPKSWEGKRAVIFSASAILWGILLPFIPFPEWIINFWWTQAFFGGPPRILILFVLLILGFYYQRQAVFKIKDRTILVMVLFVIFCLIAAFWILFIIGEFVFSH